MNGPHKQAGYEYCRLEVDTFKSNDNSNSYWLVCMIEEGPAGSGKGLTNEKACSNMIR